MRHLAVRLMALALLAQVCAACGGCALWPRFRPTSWTTPLPDGISTRVAAERELARAAALESAGDEGCVAAHFAASSLAWHSLYETPDNSQPSSAWHCYNTAVARLLLSAQRFGKLNPAQGLVIEDGNGSLTVPVAHFGFPWNASDFQRLHPPPTGREPLLVRRYVCGGVGAPLVIERQRDACDAVESRFFAEKSFFAATAVLRFDSGQPTLQFHNPVLSRTIETAAGTQPLACDLSAPLARTIDEAPRSYFAGFIEPGGAAAMPRLNFLEPYQPGKTPVVLIHGLFSDPLSWADLVNDLRATPGFAEQYQIWYFRYPSGQGFLQSAAVLRRELRAAVDQLDPNRGDTELRRIVLVGHSMGGLIAKLQVTHSDDQVWRRLANRRLDEIVATDEARALLAETCFFEPVPDVARVIFIATPHAGSLASSGLVGRGASLLVEPSPEQAAIHDQLVRDNPGVFNPEFEERLPTSIDMLESRSPLLAAMRHMRIRPGVRLHNIIGVSHPVSLDGPSDGVVSIPSAWHPGCQSVLAVGTKHAQMHRSISTSAELLRILAGHARIEPLSRTAPVPAPGATMIRRSVHDEGRNSNDEGMTKVKARMSRRPPVLRRSTFVLDSSFDFRHSTLGSPRHRRADRRAPRAGLAAGADPAEPVGDGLVGVGPLWRSGPSNDTVSHACPPLGHPRTV